MSLTLYHVPRFRSSRSLFMFYELKNIYGDKIPDLNLVQFDPNTFRTNKPKDFLALNPNGKVPTLSDGDIVMFDSCAICLYLLDTLDTDNLLAPREKQFRAKLYKLVIGDISTFSL